MLLACSCSMSSKIISKRSSFSSKVLSMGVRGVWTTWQYVMSLARASILILSRHSLFTKRALTKATSLPSIVSLTSTWRRPCRQILLIITDKLLICLSNASIRTLVTPMPTSISAKSMSMASERTRISPQLSDITSKINIIKLLRKAAGKGQAKAFRKCGDLLYSGKGCG